MKIKVGVIFGGESVEHEVSIITAIQAINKMDAEKYDVIPIYITKDRIWYTGNMLKDIDAYQDLDLIKRFATPVVLYEKEGRFILQSKNFLKRTIAEIDIAFPIVHGTNVEDGVLQGYLQAVGIPHVGCDVYASVVGQDKVFQKQIFQANKLPITDYLWFYDTDYQDDSKPIIDKATKIGFPLIVKPARLGSSIGVGVAKTEEELKEKIEAAINYDDKVVVEKLVENLMEVNISVLGNYENQELSAIEQVFSKKPFLTYEEKYTNGGKKGKLGAKFKTSKGMASASRVIPANLEASIKEELESTALKAFKLLKSSGVVRIDFLLDTNTNKLYINEINNIPGSLSYYLWSPMKKEFSELLDNMINIGIKDYKKRMNKTYSFNTNILKGFSELGIKGLKGSKKIR